MVTLEKLYLQNYWLTKCNMNDLHKNIFTQSPQTGKEHTSETLDLALKNSAEQGWI